MTLVTTSCQAIETLDAVGAQSNGLVEGILQPASGVMSCRAVSGMVVVGDLVEGLAGAPVAGVSALGGALLRKSLQPATIRGIEFQLLSTPTDGAGIRSHVQPVLLELGLFETVRGHETLVLAALLVGIFVLLHRCGKAMAILVDHLLALRLQLAK
eukprot:CAMPEP_0181517384 /NCGR_PEP_ID=MMETSP1110-20121109/64687_1 /TAXON_ID=174948 /ORGANISM="Symbiodinium sp., Strain CCMP421" /LENGTH=155 /DNA_ID=CAMNT_0023647681 /DNA_START=383 /DNA_END=851 /DNA_ORIENTATION=+